MLARWATRGATSACSGACGCAHKLALDGSDRRVPARTLSLVGTCVTLHVSARVRWCYSEPSAQSRSHVSLRFAHAQCVRSRPAAAERGSADPLNFMCASGGVVAPAAVRAGRDAGAIVRAHWPASDGAGSGALCRVPRPRASASKCTASGCPRAWHLARGCSACGGLSRSGAQNFDTVERPSPVPNIPPRDDGPC